MPRQTDVLVLGAGVLGVTVAYWLTSLYDCTVTLADRSPYAGANATARNTGVIHRPFYLDPVKKRVFARSALISRGLWKAFAEEEGLPWSPTGTYNAAVEEREIRTLETYRAWGVENGMDATEMELLDAREVRSREPEVTCRAALYSKTDVSVDFAAFTRRILRRLLSKGVGFLGGRELTGVRKEGGGALAEFESADGRELVRCGFLVNAAGGGALGVAQRMGFARRFAALHFRGEYWVVEGPLSSKVTSNVYRPPRFPQYPFLDPHFVVRADGSRQIGPNAVVVPGPYVYSGAGLTKLPQVLERPAAPKVRLLADRGFASLVLREWRSSLSKGVMCGRVKEFIPALEPSMLKRHAVFGVRSSVVDAQGFVSEALLFKGEGSAHIINYNSPGATGAPAYSARVVDELRSAGLLARLRPRKESVGLPGWSFDDVIAGF
ncbi:MAG: FAD-dependent oxidoreductase [Nitrososphaerota archaeon]|nr:FAD-dependent oxidoreductase [Nitrososphaerota archaeon]